MTNFYAQQNPSENTLAAVINLFTVANVSFNKRNLLKSLAMQTQTNSLLAISNCMKDLGVEGFAVEATLDQLISDVPFPCIAHLGGDSGGFVVVKSVTENSIAYVDANDGMLQHSLTEFASLWNGVLFIPDFKVESPVHSLMSNIYSRAFMYGFLALIVITGFVFLNLEAKLILVGVMGLGISTLILKSKFQQKQSLFCPANAKVSCLDVFNSAQANLFGFIDLSQLAFSYFLSFLLCLGFAVSKHSFSSFTQLFTVLALVQIPVVIYSIYVQAFQLKKWCLLCLGLATVLLLNSLTLKPNLDLFYRSSNYSIFLVFLVAFISVFSSLRIFMPWFSNYQEHKTARSNALSNYELAKLLGSFRRVNFTTSEQWLELGNQKGNVHLKVFLSPTCPACAFIWPFLAEWSEDSNTSLKIMLMPNLQGSENELAFVNHLNHLGQHNNRASVIASLDKWYAKKDSEKYVMENEKNLDSFIENLNSFNKLELEFLPSIIVNDKLFSNKLSVDFLSQIVACLQRGNTKK